MGAGGTHGADSLRKDSKTPLNESGSCATLNSTDARAQKALDLKLSGARPSQIMQETGLVPMKNGSLQEEIGGAVVWSGENGQAGRNVQDSQTVQGQRISETSGAAGLETSRTGGEDYSSGRGRKKRSSRTDAERSDAILEASD